MNSIFHMSGQASLIQVRELLSLMPCAVTITDADTSEVLAMSPVAKAMFGLDEEGWYRAMEYRRSTEEWRLELEALEQAKGQPLRVCAQLMDVNGHSFPAIGSFMLTTMANRRVIVSTVEQGIPFKEGDEPVVLEPNIWRYSFLNYEPLPDPVGS